MDDFDAITAAWRAEERLEQLAEAREVLAAGDAARTFADTLRRIAPSEVVAVTMTDGATVRGRLLRVGADGFRLVEVADALGSARAHARRVHEVRIDAVVRVSREPGR